MSKAGNVYHGFVFLFCLYICVYTHIFGQRTVTSTPCFLYLLFIAKVHYAYKNGINFSNMCNNVQMKIECFKV
jgi:hypothetical protein